MLHCWEVWDFNFAETPCSQIHIWSLVEIGMQESMLLVSLDVTRMESYGGHFRSSMRAEVCQMCRLTDWVGWGCFCGFWGEAGLTGALPPLAQIWFQNESQIAESRLAWAVCVCVVLYMLVQGNTRQTGAFIKKTYICNQWSLQQIIYSFLLFLQFYIYIISTKKSSKPLFN